jgi:hypothetical protein
MASGTLTKKFTMENQHLSFEKGKTRLKLTN